MTPNDFKRAARHYLLNVLRNYRARYDEDIHLVETPKFTVRKGICYTSLHIRESNKVYNISITEESGLLDGYVAMEGGESCCFFYNSIDDEDTECSKVFDAYIHKHIHNDKELKLVNVDNDWRFKNHA